MSKYFFLLVVPLLFACEKRKEKKFTGTFQGTASWYKEGNEFDEELGEYLPNVIRTEGIKEVTVEVVRSGDFIFISNYTDHKININHIRAGQASLYYLYRGGGGRGFEYTLTESNLSYRRSHYKCAASFDYSFVWSFEGTKVE